MTSGAGGVKGVGGAGMGRALSGSPDAVAAAEEAGPLAAGAFGGGDDSPHESRAIAG